jgi:uncharacterized protein YodC (DUF2158 family)
MEHKFKRGDLVKLKSGGPVMTIDNYERSRDIASIVYGTKPSPSEDTEYVNCTWFDNKNSRKFGRFHQDLLEQVTL